MKIFKYKIEDGGLSLPLGAKILSCQPQDHCLHLWALVNPEETTMEHYDVKIIGTGHEFEPHGWDYLTTVQDSIFVWHVWYKKVKA